MRDRKLKRNSPGKERGSRPSLFPSLPPSVLLLLLLLSPPPAPGQDPLAALSPAGSSRQRAGRRNQPHFLSPFPFPGSVLCCPPARQSPGGSPHGGTGAVRGLRSSPRDASRGLPLGIGGRDRRAGPTPAVPSLEARGCPARPRGGVGEAPPEGVGKGEIATPRPLSGEAAAAGLGVPLSQALLPLWGPKYVPPTPGNIWSELRVLRGLPLSGKSVRDRAF